MYLCSVFSKSPVNVLSYFQNLKNKEDKDFSQIKSVYYSGF